MSKAIEAAWAELVEGLEMPVMLNNGYQIKVPVDPSWFVGFLKELANEDPEEYMRLCEGLVEPQDESPRDMGWVGDDGLP